MFYTVMNLSEVHKSRLFKVKAVSIVNVSIKYLLTCSDFRVDLHFDPYDEFPTGNY